MEMNLQLYLVSSTATTWLNALLLLILLAAVSGNAQPVPADDSNEEEPPKPGYFGDDRDEIDGANFLLIVALLIGPMILLCCIYKIRQVKSERRRNAFVADHTELRRRATEQMVVARRAQELRDRERQRQNPQGIGSGVGMMAVESSSVDELHMHALVIDCLFPEHKVDYVLLMCLSFALFFFSSLYVHSLHEYSLLLSLQGDEQATISITNSSSSDDEETTTPHESTFAGKKVILELDEVNESTCPVCLEQIGTS